ncbi:MAG: putative redox protein [Planctomycetota bacterium]|jgi:putative redox protein
MVEIKMEYLGELRVEAEHGPSGARLNTDAPLDNCGKGESFSPTDLLATALGTCVMTIMAISANKHNLDLTGAKVRVKKSMAADPHRRVGNLVVEISSLPASVDPKRRKALETAGAACPVHHSLHPDTKVELIFHWNG